MVRQGTDHDYAAIRSPDFGTGSFFGAPENRGPSPIVRRCSSLVPLIALLKCSPGHAIQDPKQQQWNEQGLEQEDHDELDDVFCRTFS
jgi:hypothetical protein